MKKIAVMGSGSWGTALAVLLNKNGHEVSLWSYRKEECEKLINDRENKEYLPNTLIPMSINIYNDIEKTLYGKDIIIIAIPSNFIRSSLKQFKKYINEKQIIVNVSKGLEEKTLLTLSQVIKSELPNNEIVVLSGPSHAEEVAKCIPTTCVAASENLKISKEIQDVFMNEYFRIYTNTDVLGVELGGALKNVIALAAGVSDGLGFGDNTKAALMTRGMAEIIRLGEAMGGKRETFNGLSGIGDLIVTCTSMHSRNRRAGILLGKGKTLEETLSNVHMVVEGVHTAKAALAFAVKYNIEMPITEQINKVLFENKKADQAVLHLMIRDKKKEH